MLKVFDSFTPRSLLRWMIRENMCIWCKGNSARFKNYISYYLVSTTSIDASVTGVGSTLYTVAATANLNSLLTFTWYTGSSDFSIDSCTYYILVISL
jgi:hypothetical protein